MADLKSATLQEIWEEIRSRCDGAVLMTVVDLSQNAEERGFFYHGGTRAFGLIEVCRRRLMDEYLGSVGEAVDADGGWDETEREV